MKKTIATKAASILLASILLVPQIGTVNASTKTTYKSMVTTKYVKYTVKKGDTLYRVASHFHVNVNDIIKINHLKNTTLHVNQTLQIPQKTTERVPVVKSPVINTISNVTSVNVFSYIISGSGIPGAIIFASAKDSKKNVSSTIRVPSSGKFSIKMNLSGLSDGVLTLSFYQKNSKGNKSSIVTKTFAKDTKAPFVSLQTLDVTAGNQNNYPVAGKTEANTSVSIAISDGVHARIHKSLTADKLGRFSAVFDVYTLNNGKLTITAKAQDQLGNIKTTSIFVNKKTDTTPPSAVSGLRAISNTTSISLNWKAPSDTDLDHYQIKYNNQTLSTKTTDFTLSPVQPNKAFSISVSAVDKSGNQSAATNTNINTLPGGQVANDTNPALPVTNLTATASDTYITLNWKAPVGDNNIDHYIINYNGRDQLTTYTTVQALDLKPSTNYNIIVYTVDKSRNISAGVAVNITTLPARVEKVYNLELSRWNIYNDATHAIETTSGLNNALQWAHSNGYNVFKVPAGTYLIAKGNGAYDPASYVTMPSDMTLLSDANTVYQKETNQYTGYKLFLIPMWSQNVTIKGGTFMGDKDTHNYYDGAVKWQAGTSYAVGDKVIPTNTVADTTNYYYYYVAQTSGTSGNSEPSGFLSNTYQPNTTITDGSVTWKQVSRNVNDGGVLISVMGAYNATIDGVKTTKSTGDGLIIGGQRDYYDEFYSGSFVTGGIDDTGKLVTDSAKIRLKSNHSLTSPSFTKTHRFEIDNINWNFTQNFDVYFYKTDGSFISKTTNLSRGVYINIPQGAASFNMVFKGAISEYVYMELHNKIVSQNVVIKNSESSYNRRQGLTVGGENNALILNNTFHHMGGAAPQSAIDVEGGFWENGMYNENFNIVGNTFYNNPYGLIFYDGSEGLAEGNHFMTTGITVSPSFGAAFIKDNYFDHVGFGATDNTHMIGNTLDGAYGSMDGDNISLNGTVFENNANLVTTASKPYGIQVSNVTLIKSYFGAKTNPVYFNNMTMDQYTPNTMNSPDGIIFNNLKVTDNMGNGGFIPGTYNNSSFQTPNVNQSFMPLQYAGTYVFNNSTFGGAGFQAGIKIYSPSVDVTFKNSTFNFSKDVPAILVEKANSIDIENSSIQSGTTAGSQKSIVMIGDDWTNANASAILKATMKGNVITSANTGVNGITTVFSGVNAPSYNIENNILHKSVLQLKSNDTNIANQLVTN
jgi:LysM repeat protein